MRDWNKVHCDKCGKTPTVLSNTTFDAAVRRAEMWDRLADLLVRSSQLDKAAKAGKKMEHAMQVAECLAALEAETYGYTDPLAVDG